MRERRWLVVAAGAVVLALAAGAIVWAQRSDNSGSTAGLRTATGAASNLARPLTYAEGQTIHFGDRTIRTGQDLLTLDVADHGVAFTTIDGSVWFTDGLTVDRVGVTTSGRVLDHHYVWGAGGRPGGWVVSDNSGSRFAWMEYTELGEPEIVVYDSARTRRVARLAVHPRSGCTRCAKIIAVRDDDVFWTDALWHGLGSDEAGRSRLFRTEVSTGKVARISADALENGRNGRARLLVVGASVGGGNLSDGVGLELAFSGSEGVATRGGSAIFDPVTRHRVRLRAPSGYGFGAAERLYLVQWLDDDRIVLLDATGWNAGRYGGEDLLTCSLASGTCAVAVRRPQSAGSLIVPEVGTPGSERAQSRATREQVALNGR